MEFSMRNNRPVVFAWLLCLAPVSYLALFYSFALRARLVLGTWPQPYQPDPKALGFDIHHTAILLGLPLLLALPILFLIPVALQPRSERKKIVLPVLVFALLALAVLLVLRIDPGSFATWFMD